MWSLQRSEGIVGVQKVGLNLGKTEENWSVELKEALTGWKALPEVLSEPSSGSVHAAVS